MLFQYFFQDWEIFRNKSVADSKFLVLHAESNRTSEIFLVVTNSFSLTIVVENIVMDCHELFLYCQLSDRYSLNAKSINIISTSISIIIISCSKSISWEYIRSCISWIVIRCYKRNMLLLYPHLLYDVMFPPFCDPVYYIYCLY